MALDILEELEYRLYKQAFWSSLCLLVFCIAFFCHAVSAAICCCLSFLLQIQPLPTLSALFTCLRKHLREGGKLSRN